jgi:superfamily II DNA or RNA helicase
MSQSQLTDAALPIAPVQAPQVPFLSAVFSDGKRVALRTVMHPSASSEMRRLAGTWCGGLRAWVFTVDAFKNKVLHTLPSTVRRAGLFAIESDELAERARLAYRSHTANVVTEHLDCQLLPLKDGGFVCQFQYDPLLVECMRDLKGRWHKNAAAWELRQPIQEVLSALHDVAGVAEDLIFVHDQVIELEELAGPSENEMGLVVAGAAPVSGFSGEQLSGNAVMAVHGDIAQLISIDEERLDTAVEQYGLYDFQREGVAHLMSRTGALLADDMGLGKTRQAIVAAHLAAKGGRILVACPASLRINWSREIKGCLPEALIADVGENDAAALDAAQWHVSTYERLGAVVRSPAMQYAVFVVDEAHYLKEHSANRTRNALLIAQRTPHRMLLTGTPVLNRESEIHTLLRLSGHPVGRLTSQEFHQLYAGTSERRAWLRTNLADWMLRRSKNVLKNLQGKSHQVVYISPEQGLAEYNAVLQDPSLMAIAKVGKLRQLLERIKTDWIVESLKKLPADEKALVFCEFVDTVAVLKQALAAVGISAVTLTGADAPKTRQKAVDALQEDESVPVFIGTTAAAGVGITLTRATYVFFASIPWTPALKNQAEDRAYRNGQTKHVIVRIPLIAETVDEGIYSLIQHKASVADAVIETQDAGENLQRFARTLRNTGSQGIQATP